MILLKVLIGVVLWSLFLEFSVNVTPEFIQRRIKKMKTKEAGLLSILLAVLAFFLAKETGAPYPALIATGAMLTIGAYLTEVKIGGFKDTEEDKLAKAQFRAQIRQLLDQGEIKEALKLFGKHIKHTVSYSGMKETARETWRAWE